MNQRLSFVVMFIFITFGAMAKDTIHLDPVSTHSGGFHRNIHLADTDEKPDEHVRKAHYRTFHHTYRT